MNILFCGKKWFEIIIEKKKKLVCNITKKKSKRQGR